MNTAGWIILIVLVVPMLGILAWVVITESVVRVPSGSLGLLMVKGRATDTTLLPGSHFVPALRRRMVEEYPSVELAYRAGGPADPEKPELNQSGPPLQITLGDRTTVVLSVTVRFRLLPEQLRLVHERFGPNGFFGVTRDQTHRAVISTLGATEIGIDSLFGPARGDCEEHLRATAASALTADGIDLISLLLGVVDLGRTGEVIAATERARHELERENAEAATRMARALNDSNLEHHLTRSTEGAWRYRETDLWRDLVQRTDALSVALRAGPGDTGVAITAAGAPEDQPQEVEPS